MLAALALLLAWMAHAAVRNAAPSVALTSPAANANFPGGSNIAITATAADSDGSIARVDFYADGKLLARDTTAPFATTWSNAGNGTHTLKAVAVDNRKASTTSAATAITVGTPDTIAPSIPSGLAATARTSSSIALAWNVSADNIGGSGIAGYDVYRNGALVASTANAGYTDTALQPATGYSYAVRARDKAGNASAQSAALVVATAADTVASRRVVAYFTQWGIYNQKHFVRTLDASGAAAKLTHLTYAFGNVRNNRCEVGVLKAVDPATGEGGDAFADYSRTFAATESVDGVADVWANRCAATGTS
jgi:chitinase